NPIHAPKLGKNYGMRCVLPKLSLRALHKSTMTGDRPSDNKRVNFFRSFVRINGFSICYKACDIVLQKYTISSEQLPGVVYNRAHPERARNFCQRGMLI